MLRWRRRWRRRRRMGREPVLLDWCILECKACKMELGLRRPPGSPDGRAILDGGQLQLDATRTCQKPRSKCRWEETSALRGKSSLGMLWARKGLVRALNIYVSEGTWEPALRSTGWFNDFWNHHQKFLFPPQKFGYSQRQPSSRQHSQDASTEFKSYEAASTANPTKSTQEPLVRSLLLHQEE